MVASFRCEKAVRDGFGCFCLPDSRDLVSASCIARQGVAPVGRWSVTIFGARPVGERVRVRSTVPRLFQVVEVALVGRR